MRADDQLLEMMRCYEALIETRDDVTDYDEDLERNSFNVLVMLAKLHGSEAARGKLLERIRKIERRYQRCLGKIDSDARARHEQYVRLEKGGMWLWESIVPQIHNRHDSLLPRKPPVVPQLSNSPLYSFFDIQKAVAVLQHTWTVSASFLPVQSSSLPLVSAVVQQALRAVTLKEPSTTSVSETTLLLMADGRRLNEAVKSSAGSEISLSEVWDLCRWRSYDTLMVLEGLCETYMVQMTDAWRALILTLDIQYCLAFDLLEFRLTIVRDAEGRISFCSLEEDGLQLNAAMLIHRHCLEHNVEEIILGYIEELHQECLMLLKELSKQVASSYHMERERLIDQKLMKKTI